MPLGRVRIVIPGEAGVFGFADAGRVFLNGESSDQWHHAFRGGVWLSWLGRQNTIAPAVARSPERTGVYVRAGFAF